MTAKRNKQVTGNVGMYFVCYHLSRLGLNVLPTSRNAKGADIIAYTENQKHFYTIQVKAMTKLANIKLGSSLDSIECDWWIVVVDVYQDPIAYVVTKQEVIASARPYTDGHWAQGKTLATPKALNAWGRILEGTSSCANTIS